MKVLLNKSSGEVRLLRGDGDFCPDRCREFTLKFKMTNFDKELELDLGVTLDAEHLGLLLADEAADFPCEVSGSVDLTDYDPKKLRAWVQRWRDLRESGTWHTADGVRGMVPFSEMDAALNGREPPTEADDALNEE